MEKSKKLKIFIGLFYLILFSSFLIIFFSKYSFEEIKSYEFIQQNRDYFFNLKEANFLFIFLIFFIFIIIWTFFGGFGSPVALIGGFIFGKFLGTFVVILGLTCGATFLYIFANYFFKDFIRDKLLFKFKNLESKFKKHEFNYFIGTFIGIIPQIFLIASLGSGLDQVFEQNENVPSISDLIFSPEIYIPILGFFFIVLATLIIRKIFFKN